MLLFAAIIALGSSQAAPVKPAETSGSQMILKMRAAVRALSPVEGLLESTGPTGQKAVMDFKAMYPKLFSGTMKMFGLETQIVWNGEQLHMYMAANKSHQSVKRDAMDIGLVGIESLFGDEEYFSQVGECKNETLENRPVVSIPMVRTAGKMSRHITLFVDPKTMLPAGYDEEDPGAGGTSRSVYRKLAHAKLTAKDFEFKAPGVE